MGNYMTTAERDQLFKLKDIAHIADILEDIDYMCDMELQSVHHATITFSYPGLSQVRSVHLPVMDVVEFLGEQKKQYKAQLVELRK